MTTAAVEAVDHSFPYTYGDCGEIVGFHYAESVELLLAF